MSAKSAFTQYVWLPLYQQFRLLVGLKSSPRPWHFPLLSGLCTGLPVLIGAYFGHVEQGVLAGLGGMVILYMPQTSMGHRMLTLVVCAFGFAACYTLTVLIGGVGWVAALLLGCISLLVNFSCRFYHLPWPGRFFFIMIAALASNANVELAQVPSKLGLLMMGSMGACLLAFIYSLVLPAKQGEPVCHSSEHLRLTPLWAESAVIGVVVGSSLLLAIELGVSNPYWVPISCAAILQGSSVQLLFTRQVQRILGTVIGLVFAWLLFSLPPNPWWIASTIMMLTFAMETVILRNYGLAVIFITPLAVLFANFILLGQFPAEQLVSTRMQDTVLGSACGFVGGLFLHLPWRGLRQHPA